LLKEQFNAGSGLQLTLLQGKKQPVRIQSGIQIVYLCNWLHWCVASTVSCQKNEVKIYDSMFSSPDSEMRSLFMSQSFLKQTKLVYEPVQKQEGGDDYGVFSIAFATALVTIKIQSMYSLCKAQCGLIC